jgi:hypothetical protein
MNTGTKVYIVETGEIGVVLSTTVSGHPKLVEVGKKVVDVAGYTVKILTYLLQIILFIKKILGK